MFKQTGPRAYRFLAREIGGGDMTVAALKEKTAARGIPHIGGAPVSGEHKITPGTEVTFRAERAYNG